MAGLGRYELVGPLSPEAEGASQLAAQKGLGGYRRWVALKRLDPAEVADELLNQQFVADIKTAVALAHPAIVRVGELVAQDGALFVASDLVAGVSLYDLAHSLPEGELVPAGLVLLAVRDAAYALNYAHTFVDPFGRPRPLLHRRVSDHNLFVTFEGATQLGDFGLPSPLKPAPRASSFLAPEQLRGEALDARTDVFSLGAVLHSHLTGRSYAYAEVVARAPSQSEFPPPSKKNPALPPQLDAVLMRALYPSKESRYANALELARELEKVAAASFFSREASAAWVRSRFEARRAWWRDRVQQEEQRETTAVMPLKSLLVAAPPPTQSVEIPLGDLVEDEPTRPRQARPAEPPSPPPPAEAFVSVDDLPATGAAKRPSRAVADADDADDADDDRPPAPRPRKTGRRLLALLLVLVAGGLAAAKTLAPEWLDAQVRRVRGAPPPLPEPPPLLEEDAGELDAGMEAPDAGDAADAGEEPLDAGTVEEADAGAALTPAPAKKKPSKADLRKKKRRTRER